MRILTIGPIRAGTLPSSYARALEGCGHEVFRFDSDRAYCRASKRAGNRFHRRLFRRGLWHRLNVSTIELVSCLRPAIVLAFKTSYLDPETIRYIRVEEGIPFANYYPDNPYCGVPLDPRKTSTQRRNLIKALREYTCVFTWDMAMVRRLAASGVTASYLPFGADPECLEVGAAGPCEACGRRHEVIFIGVYNRKREQHISAIRNHEVAIWGPNWQRAARKFRGRHVIHKERCFGRAGCAMYGAAKISLNILNDLNMPGHNMRTFEIPASGGVMVATYTPEQAGFFPEGETAWYYRDPSELDDIIGRLLADDEARKRARRLARATALKHDYGKRAQAIVRHLIG